MTEFKDNKDKKDTAAELTRQMKKKRLRKYVLAVLAIAVVITAVAGIRLEGKDAKLADGQGNVVSYTQSADNAEADIEDKASEKKKKEKSEQEQEKKEVNEENTKTDKKADKQKKKKTPKEAAVDNSDDFTASNDGNVALKPETAAPVTVTVEIVCHTISGDMDKLENEAIRDYIPEDGYILKTAAYHGTTENTVFDVLNTVCRNSDIQLEFSYSPIYESYYIEGINHLYEFDAGPLSGWMYKVNGWFPNYGCSSYYLSDGDHIVWTYSCDKGKDVGDNSMSY